MQARRCLRSLPNLITLARLLLCGPLLHFFRARQYTALLVTYACMELLDQADGKIAVAFRLQTQAGRYFDPFADSVTHLSAFACLLTLGLLPLWMYLVMLFRELGLLFLRLLGALQGQEVSSHYAGKVKALVHAVVVLLCFAGLRQGAPVVPTAPLVDLAVLASVLSGLVYLHRYRRVLQVAFASSRG